MRVLMVDASLYTPPYDGALGEALRKTGVDVTLAARHARDDDAPLGGEVPVRDFFYRRSEGLRRRHGPSTGVQALKLAEHILDMRRFREVATGPDFDIVHWQWVSVPLMDERFLRAIGRHKPQVITVHDTDLFRTASWTRRLSVSGWIGCLKTAGGLIAHVKSTCDRLVAQGISADKIHVIPHGVFARPNAVHEQPTVSDKLNVYFFGRIQEYKGVLTLAEAVLRLPDAIRAKLAVRIAGHPMLSADSLRRLREAAASSGVIELDLRFQSEQELASGMEWADLIVFPYTDIDASGVLMKSLGYDVGVLLSDLPAFREVLSNGAESQFCNSQNIDAWSDALANYATNPDLVAAAKEVTRQLRTGQLDWMTIAGKTRAVYEQLLDR